MFTISKGSDAPTITSNRYLFFGSVEVEMQVAPGTGVVTSFVLQSDDLDEVDWVSRFQSQAFAVVSHDTLF